MLKIVKAKDFYKLKRVSSSPFLGGSDVSLVVSNIVSDVVARGDVAVFEYTAKFDNFTIDASNIKVTTEEINEAFKSADKGLIDALQAAYTRVMDYHKRQMPLDERWVDATNTNLGWKWNAINSVGLYVPGGQAFYPSSVLMNAVPAIVAGVKNISIVVPTPNGYINPVLLVAAKICGVEDIYRVGGAQAIAALAFGTDSIPKVNKIVGPGNKYVAEAKRQVFGVVGIDMIAGPSEILVVADKYANYNYVAADLLSQAEHDVDARSILITDDESFASRVCDKLEIYLERIKNEEIARQSLKNNSYIIVVDDVERDAPDIINEIAPEHLEIITQKPNAISNKVQNAGAIFLGQYSAESIGDYIAGPSHVLPTSAAAKFSSGLGVLDFMKRTSMIGCSAEGIAEFGYAAERIARAEGLDAHALSVRLRLDDVVGG